MILLRLPSFLLVCLPLIYLILSGCAALVDPSGGGVKQSLIIEVVNSSIIPDVARKNQEVTVSVTYKISGTFGAPVVVQQSKVLLYKGSVVAVLSKDVIERKEGTWENSLAFTIPSSAENGIYTIEQNLKLEGRAVSDSKTFEIIR